ncbi:hypothetical protein [Spirillospora sp. NBC_01491]|uniref:hypothetical protein n=1 Tax=Spirillospora sp. NBC_01491 TaxID=2976007 RepID=UPI002E2F3290|nr:hypothetical protein [Spirillospora sp. NBC_01491]
MQIPAKTGRGRGTVTGGLIAATVIGGLSLAAAAPSAAAAPATPAAATTVTSTTANGPAVKKMPWKKGANYINGYSKKCLKSSKKGKVSANTTCKKYKGAQPPYVWYAWTPDKKISQLRNRLTGKCLAAKKTGTLYTKKCTSGKQFQWTNSTLTHKKVLVNRKYGTYLFQTYPGGSLELSTGYGGSPGGMYNKAWNWNTVAQW